MSCESISTGAPILRDQSLSVKLLEWYDEYGRNLPWRVRGASERKPDPYLVWLSEIMLQQTTVAAVKPYFQRFVELWPTVRGLASADEAQVMSEWAGLGYYSRARNLIKCARIVAWERGGEFPSEQSGLLSLPGIGPYTAAAISSIAFGRRATVVDGNVERVIARMRLVRSRTPSAKKGNPRDRGRPDADGTSRRLRPSIDGLGSHRLQAEESELRNLPLDGVLHGTERRRSEQHSGASPQERQTGSDRDRLRCEAARRRLAP